jgi:hypothetical protein
VSHFYLRDLGPWDTSLYSVVLNDSVVDRLLELKKLRVSRHRLVESINEHARLK